MRKTKKKLGEILLEQGLIDDLQLKSALAEQKEWGGRIGSIIIKKGFVSEKDIITILEKQLGYPCFSLEGIEKPSDEVLDLIKVDTAKKYCIFPLRLEGRTIVIAISDPTDLKTLDEISFKVGFRIKPLLALESDIINAIGLHYEGKTSYGRTFTIDKEELAKKISRTMPMEMDIEHSILNSADDRAWTKDKVSPKKILQRDVIEGIIDLLIKKGIFTKEELINHIKSRNQS